MTTKDRAAAAGELNDEQLDGVAGGQEVRKLDKITVTAKRPAKTEVVQLDKVVVSARRDGVQVASTAVNTAGVKSK